MATRIQTAAVIAGLLIAGCSSAPPSQATDLSRSISIFCKGMLNANKQGLSAAPGSIFATYVAAKAGQSPEKFQMLWGIAKASSNRDCKRMY